MKLIAEVDGDYFDKEGGRRRIYVSFDELGRQQLIKVLEELKGRKNGTTFKMLPKDWGHYLSSDNYYEDAIPAEFLEFTILDE